MKRIEESNESYRALRAKSGMTQQAFAAYFKVPYNTAQKWEQGKSNCSPYLVELMEYKLKNEGLIK